MLPVRRSTNVPTVATLAVYNQVFLKVDADDDWAFTTILADWDGTLVEGPDEEHFIAASQVGGSQITQDAEGELTFDLIPEAP